MDVKCVFLNRYLQHEFYVKQPLGFENTILRDYVIELNKALYRLKQVHFSLVFIALALIF